MAYLHLWLHRNFYMTLLTASFLRISVSRSTYDRDPAIYNKISDSNFHYSLFGKLYWVDRISPFSCRSNRFTLFNDLFLIMVLKIYLITLIYSNASWTKKNAQWLLRSYHGLASYCQGSWGTLSRALTRGFWWSTSAAGTQ